MSGSTRIKHSEVSAILEISFVTFFVRRQLKNMHLNKIILLLLFCHQSVQWTQWFEFMVWDVSKRKWWIFRFPDIHRCLKKKSPLNMSWRRVSSTRARRLRCRSQTGQTAHAVSGEKPGLFFDQPAQLWPSMHRCMNYFTQDPVRNTCTFRCKQLRWGEERGGLVQKVIQVMFSYFCVSIIVCWKGIQRHDV